MPRPTIPPPAAPLGAPIPVEPGRFDELAASVLRLAVHDAQAGSQGAREWLEATGGDWADALAPGKGGPLVRDALAELERRGESAYRRLMKGY